MRAQVRSRRATQCAPHDLRRSTVRCSGRCWHVKSLSRSGQRNRPAERNGWLHSTLVTVPAERVSNDPGSVIAPPTRDHSTLGSVRTAARVLRAFSEVDQELGVNQVARRLGIGKSTAHRVLSTLAAERLLERNAATGRYRLGLALYELGTTVTEHVDLHQAALPVLTTFRHSTGEMVHVAVLDGLEVVYVERLESHHMLPDLPPGRPPAAGHLDQLRQGPARVPPARRARPEAAGLGTVGPYPAHDHRPAGPARRAGAGERTRLGPQQRGGTPGHRVGGCADPRVRRRGPRRGIRGRRDQPDAGQDAPASHPCGAPCRRTRSAGD